MKLFNLRLLFIGLSVSTPLMAKTLSMSDTDIKRLDIQFAAVKLVDYSSGVQVPATVIYSPNTQSTAIAQFGGIINQWLVVPGSEVAEGAVLATLTSQQMVDVQQRWLASKNQFDQAIFEREKDRQLFDDGVISQQRLKQTSRAYQQAKFYLEAMTEVLAQAGFTEESRRKLIAGAIKPGVYFLTAPNAGRVSQRHFVVGDYVEANTQVATLQGSDLLWLRAQVPAKLAAVLQVGQKLSLVGSKGLLTLKQKNLQVSQPTQMVEILAEFSQVVDLMPGKTVLLRLPPAIEGAIIPASAVVHSGDETGVFVRIQDGVELRTLQLQPAGANYLAQKEIEVGDEVAVQGASVLKGIVLGLGGDE